MTKKKSGIINTDLRAEMAIFEIESNIRAIEKNTALYDEKNFDMRIEAIDFIEFGIIDQVEAILQKAIQPAQLISLKHRAEKVKSELEKIDINLFQKLRAKMRTTGSTEHKFKKLVSEYVVFNLGHNEHQEEPGYDNLDLFINGLFPYQTMPEQTKALEPEMVFYQKTPARIVFEMVEKSEFTKDDVFFDLGSGLGQVAILVNLLAGIKVKGVEMEPAFCDYARDCAAAFNLSNVAFINTDARKADYSDGTAFFMYTPFGGEMLQEVLEILRKESLSRKIKIITYGPCTTQVALQSWLLFEGPQDVVIYKPIIFISI